MTLGDFGDDVRLEGTHVDVSIPGGYGQYCGACGKFMGNGGPLGRKPCRECGVSNVIPARCAGDRRVHATFPHWSRLVCGRGITVPPRRRCRLCGKPSSRRISGPRGHTRLCRACIGAIARIDAMPHFCVGGVGYVDGAPPPRPGRPGCTECGMPVFGHAFMHPEMSGQWHRGCLPN